MSLKAFRHVKTASQSAHFQSVGGCPDTETARVGRKSVAPSANLHPGIYTLRKAAINHYAVGYYFKIILSD
jgi:hypothetical protein